MWYLLLLEILALLIPAEKKSNTFQPLFPISVEGKMGFIDSTGRVVIEPQFRAVNDFSEGLCAVRVDGLYGFIDATGKMIIDPKFDYATYFKEGLALAYKGGKAIFIDSSGNQAFDFPLRWASEFKNGRAKVNTFSERQGMINKHGKLVIDTLYQSLSNFVDGYSIVEGINHQPYDSDEKPQRFEVGIIDSSGVATVPYGVYSNLSYLREGYVAFEIPSKSKRKESQEGLMDCNGKIIYLLPERDGWISGGVHEGIFRVSLSKSKRSDEQYDVYVNLKGEKILDDKKYEFGHDFSNGRAFVNDNDNMVSMIDTKGRILLKDKFLSVEQQEFKNGRALVKTSDGWGVIDTSGVYILEPVFPGASECRLAGDVLIVDEIQYLDTADVYKFSVVNLKGEVIISESLEYVDNNGFVNGLLRAASDNLLRYYNRKGEIVWQEEFWEPALAQPLNVDFMIRGYFCAPYNFTGHGSSGENSATREIGRFNDFPIGLLSVVAKPDESVAMEGRIKGMRVYVANATGDTINFNAQDSRLNMKIQALDAEGKWRDIEYLPSSWCGNSYHISSLPKNHFWQFDAPVYEGVFSTMLRIELEYISAGISVDSHSRREKEVRYIYSNEFPGKINPGQFWLKREYQRQGIMDPYNE